LEFVIYLLSVQVQIMISHLISLISELKADYILALSINIMCFIEDNNAVPDLNLNLISEFRVQNVLVGEDNDVRGG